MIPGWVLWGELPWATLPDADSQATVSVEFLLIADQDAEYIFVFEATPSGGTMLRLSDVGYITAGTDTPADTPYRDRLLTPYNIDNRIPAPDDGAAAGELAFGVIELETGDEVLDAQLAQSLEGREVTIKVGGRYHVGRVTEGSLTFAQFQVIQRATISAVAWEDGRILFSLRERLNKLRQQVQTNTYAGTGGLEGTDLVKERRKPLVYGEVFNFEPVLLDPNNQIYQWHDGAVQGVTAVRDKGVALTSEGDVADITATSAPSLGAYKTQNSGGYIRLGQLPEDGRITIDGLGDKTGGTYADDIPTIVRRIGVRAGLSDPADFEYASFGAFPETGPVGIAFRGDEAITALEAMSRLVVGAFGYISQTRSGQLRIGKYTNPDVGSPATTITDDTLLSIRDETVRPPIWKVEVGYAQNWTPQDPDSLAGSLTVDTRDLYATPNKTASDDDASLQTTHPDAQLFQIVSYFADEADAQALATEVLGILGRRARLYTLEVARQMFKVHPGAVIRVDSRDSDLAGGRNLFLVSVAEDASTRLNRWEAWG